MVKRVLGVFGLLAIGGIIIFMVGGIPRSKGKTDNLSKIKTVGLPEYGIEIVGPAQTAFATMMAERLQKTSGVNVGALRSSSVFVVNKSRQSIAALSVRWELLQADGPSIVHHRGYRGGIQVISNAEPTHLSEQVAPNDHLLVSLLDVSNSSNGSIRTNLGGGGNIELLHGLSESVEVTISVDGVLFVDGTFAGPDTRDFFGSLKAEIEARNEVYAEIVRALNGDSEAMKRIEVLAKGNREGIQMSSARGRSDDQLVKEQLARATLAIRKDLGDKAVLERINAELSKPRINLRKL